MMQHQIKYAISSILIWPIHTSNQCQRFVWFCSNLPVQQGINTSITTYTANPFPHMIPFSSILRSTVLTNPYNKVMVFFLWSPLKKTNKMMRTILMLQSHSYNCQGTYPIKNYVHILKIIFSPQHLQLNKSKQDIFIEKVMECRNYFLPEANLTGMICVDHTRRKNIYTDWTAN